MHPEIGKIYGGKVSGITNFGAFIDIGEGMTGMVHISEIANTYVNKIEDHLSVGDEVKVRVLSVNENGKVSLSIKKALEPERGRDFKGNGGGRKSSPAAKAPLTKEAAFEDMMNKFKASSDEKMSDIKKNIDGKRRNTSRKRNG